MVGKLRMRVAEDLEKGDW